MDSLEYNDLSIDDLNYGLKSCEDYYLETVKLMETAPNATIRAIYNGRCTGIAEVSAAIRYEIESRGETPRPRWNVKEAFDSMICPRCGHGMIWGGYIDNCDGESFDKWIECSECDLSLWAPVASTYPID